MKHARIRKLVATCLLMALCLALAAPALAADGYSTQNVTKYAGPIKLTFYLEYESYTGSLGTKLVRNAGWSDVIGSTGSYYVQPVSHSLAHIDGGRTYAYTATIKYASSPNGPWTQASATAYFYHKDLM